jgi:hypothetical protein
MLIINTKDPNKIFDYYHLSKMADVGYIKAALDKIHFTLHKNYQNLKPKFFNFRISN